MVIKFTGSEDLNNDLENVNYSEETFSMDLMPFLVSMSLTKEYYKRILQKSVTKKYYKNVLQKCFTVISY